ncbi:hypothetical protein DFP72DRAFT_744537, partial [Ephemerocybe angulata]
HFTAFTHRVGSDSFEYGDSMHDSPDLAVGHLLQQSLSTKRVPLPSAVVSGTINRQGGSNGGGGSCGVASFNFIQRHITPGRRMWAGSMAREFRDEILGNLIHYSVLSQESVGTANQW